MAKVELKQPIVEEIANNIKDAQAVVLVDYSGLTVEPVSYTHLDVYKRQYLACPKFKHLIVQARTAF